MSATANAAAPHAGASATPPALRTQIHNSATSPADSHTFSSPEPYHSQVAGVISCSAVNTPAAIAAASSPASRRSIDYTSTTIAANTSISRRTWVATGSNRSSRRSSATAKNTSGLL